jgi:hypothetical protein
MEVRGLLLRDRSFEDVLATLQSAHDPESKRRREPIYRSGSEPTLYAAHSRAM